MGSATATPATPAVSYSVTPHDLNAHLWRVQVTVHEPAALQTLSLPVWLAGSYMVREFSKHLQGLWAKQSGRVVNATQLSKNTWQVACKPGRPLVVGYDVYAFDSSVRTAWLDAKRGFFNATSLCLRAHGFDDAALELTLNATKSVADWAVYTGLSAKTTAKGGFGSYAAANYDELADCPFELGLSHEHGGDLWHGEFVACGTPHHFVVTGAAPGFDGERLLIDTQAICENIIQLWHSKGRAPMKSYLFMLNAVDDGYGGLEHRNSTALICKRADLPRFGQTAWSEGTTTLMGLISHEYFHTWNVKRLRPGEFARYNYDSEQYTHLLWFFEGFTSYYDDLVLRRTGLIDDKAYLGLLQKTLNGVLQTPGRHVQSVAQASFDAWVKYYRQDDNTPNATVSYYTKGALVALCFDLALRQTGKATLDDVMRALWVRCKAGPMAEADFLAALNEASGQDFSARLTAWVHGTDDLPVQDLLATVGVAARTADAPLAQRLGLRVSEAGGALRIKHVLTGGAAQLAGFSPGDEWVGLQVEVGAGKTKRQQAWRLQQLDDVLLYAGRAKRVVALVARDKRLIQLPLALPPAATVLRLAVVDTALAAKWLTA